MNENVIEKKTYQELLTLAEKVRDAKLPSSNTASLVGGLLVGIVEALGGEDGLISQEIGSAITNVLNQFTEQLGDYVSTDVLEQNYYDKSAVDQALSAATGGDKWSIGTDGYWYKNGQKTEYKASTAGDLSGYVKAGDLASVARSGNYSDLNGKPSIPTKTSDLTNDSGFVSSSTLTASYYDKAGVDNAISTALSGYDGGGSSYPELFSYRETSTNVGNLETSLDKDGCETILFKATSACTIAIPNSYVAVDDNGYSLSVDGGKYAEINFIRHTDSNDNVTVYVRSAIKTS